MPQTPHENPIPDPTTDVGRRHAELYDALAEARLRPREARDARTEAASALIAAKEAYYAEIARGARSGRDPKTEEKLLDKVQVAEKATDDGVHGFREREAHRTVRDAEAAYLAFVQQNRDDLLAELEPDAIEIESELTEAFDRIRPLHERWFQVRQNVKTITLLASGGDLSTELVYGENAIPDAPAAPLPASYRRRVGVESEREPVTVEADS